MPTVDLDFLRGRPASPSARWVLFAIAAALTLDLGVSYYTLRSRIAENELRLSEIRHSTATAARKALVMRTPTAEEVRVAADTLQKLAMPWEKLFSALESSARDDVALLAIEPEAKAGTVLISGEATTYRAALEYVALLHAAGTLERPHLVRHERKPNAPDAVAFSIMATWGRTK